jgi:hypothetical protein
MVQHHPREATEQVTEPVTLDFAARRRPRIIIRVPEGDFPIDPNIDVEDMGEALVAEQAAQELIDMVLSARFGELKLDKPDELKKKARDHAVTIKGFVMHLIRRLTPGAPDLALKADEVLEIARELSGNDSITKEVVDAITSLAGSDALTDASDAGGEGGPDAAGEAGDTAPLPSNKPSPGRSSSSASSKGGRRTTGSGSRGGSSKRT